MKDESNDGPWITSLNPALLVSGSVLLAAVIILAIIAAIKVGQSLLIGAAWILAVAGVVGIVLFLSRLAVTGRHHQREYLFDLYASIEAKGREIRTTVQRCFLIEPCARCQEFTMALTEVSPNGRSITYKCLHCNKTTYAAAGTPKAHDIVSQRAQIDALIAEYNASAAQFSLAEHQSSRSLRREDIPVQLSSEIVFESPAGPLPYEQTSRSPIPAAIRSEVWRRDCGRCVQCESKENLQFDHIIPVAKGGATSVANLQLLCKSCNGAKSAKI